MAINFTDSPSNGATQTISGRTYTYNSAKNKWDTTATEVTGPTATVYASVDNLPTSGNITGSQAFVSGTNRLYIWNGSGWYNIALINNTPTISGASSSYALAIDGTATTVTLTATDPEGFPITYSIASDTSGNIATVAQGTGSNTNVFTITPSTNTAHAGTFSLTFRASDGVNLATAVSSFTLQFLVQNQKYTTALITSVGANNATNASFDDKSTSDHTITANGDAHQTTFSPYRHGGYSVYFDGSSDNLGFASLSAMNPNTYMSLECWVKLDDKNNANELIVGRDSGYWLMYDWPGLGVAQDKFGFGANFGGSWAGVSSTTSPESGVWYHIVGVREDTTYKIYVNGTLENTATYTSGITTGGVVGIGANTNQLGGSIKGHLADVRVIISANSSSLPYTSNFTPPTDRLTAITDTQLLACHLPYMQEGSTHGHTITMNGNVAVVPVGPHDKQEYAAADHGGSVRFDGSSDYIQAPAASVARGTGDYTIETWVYYHSLPNTYNQIWDTRTGATPTDDFLQIQSNGGLRWRNNGIGTTAAGTIKVNQWHHVAQCRSSGTVKTYVDGVEKASNTNTASLSHGAVLSIGGAPLDNGSWSNANFADFRVVLGTAVYTSAFTPPTAPLTAITNTSLLVQSTDAGIIDKAQGAHTIKLVGDTKSSTTYTKFLSSSMYFDGSGDYINLDDQDLANFGNMPFTIEGWLYLLAYPSQWNFALDTRSSGSDSNGFCVEVTPSDFGIYAGENMCRSSSAFGLNTWKHWAYTRDASGNHKVFINGTQSGSTFTGSKNYTTNKLKIAAGHNGGDNQNAYMSDIRITKGLARYTSNFTAPTAALQG